MGFTLDGIPLGDMTYDNHNGLHISRVIMSENMDSVSLAEVPARCPSRRAATWRHAGIHLG